MRYNKKVIRPYILGRKNLHDNFIQPTLEQTLEEVPSLEPLVKSVSQ